MGGSRCVDIDEEKEEEENDDHAVIRHHYTLEHVANALSALAGAQVAEVYTQEKFAIVMRLTDDASEHVLSISVDPTMGCLTMHDAANRARKNTLDVFPALCGQRLAMVTKHPDDRIITLWFTTHQLHVLFFSAGRGNIVAVENGTITDVLRERELIGTPFTITPYRPTPFVELPMSTSIERALASCELLLGPYYAHEVCERLNIDPATPLSAMEEGLRKAAWEQGEKVRDEARATLTYSMLQRSTDVLFSLLPLQGYDEVRTSDNIFMMLRTVIGRRRSIERILQQRKKAIDDVERQLHRAQRSIRGMTSDAATADRSTLYRHKGSLLLSLPVSRDTGRTSIDVEDHDGSMLTIALDAKKTVIENAHAYFAKARASDEAARVRAIRLPALQKQCEQLERQLERLRTATLDEIDTMTTAPDPKKKNAVSADDVVKKYRVFVLDDDHTVYVGKSAANNDELTMRFAKQNDLWFHARGVSGSHAILRGPDTEHPPKKILEQAAAIAAYYSNARNASYTPVVYTLRKYVRKPKGANVGAVTLERERVIMVSPSLPAGSAE
jgi:predicted ribosome quality control (RQC) complex YloA/Tae2 family protein